MPIDSNEIVRIIEPSLEAMGYRLVRVALTGAQRLAYRIVDAVHSAAVSTIPGHHLTFSVGVASYPEDAFTASELVAAADQALYLAKREGKDRACTFPQLVTELELDDSSLFAMLTKNDIAHWAERFLETLTRPPRACSVRSRMMR